MLKYCPLEVSHLEPSHTDTSEFFLSFFPKIQLAIFSVVDNGTCERELSSCIIVKVIQRVPGIGTLPSFHSSTAVVLNLCYSDVFELQLPETPASTVGGAGFWELQSKTPE